MCFSSSSLVTVEDKNDRIPVNQLKIGDSVRTMNEKGDVIFSPFLGWLHREDNVTTVFLNITTDNGASITISPRHLLMVTDTVDKARRPDPRAAAVVDIGVGMI